ncbi:MAG: Gfo/Idh/MocA family oxidoreductase [Rhodobacteraceae bacterium]|nr:Gfo/Idh/MocA family oxidoreductase [Paracoccaceae bacterium]
MIADAAAAEQPLIIAYYRRALPRFEKMRSLIAGGAVGQPRLVQITDYRAHTARPQDDWRVNPTLSGGGIFFDTQSHTIDWLGYTFGKPSRIRGITARQAEGYAAEDFVAFTGLFGEVATVATCAYALGQDREEVTVLGDKGSISMSFFAHSPLRLRRADGRNELIEIADPEHMHQPFIERVVSYLLDGTKNPCSGAEARQVNAVLSDIY